MRTGWWQLYSKAFPESRVHLVVLKFEMVVVCYKLSSYSHSPWCQSSTMVSRQSLSLFIGRIQHQGDHRAPFGSFVSLVVFEWWFCYLWTVCHLGEFIMKFYIWSHFQWYLHWVLSLGQLNRIWCLRICKARSSWLTVYFQECLKITCGREVIFHIS